ncbi:uncharacterized protein LOC119117121 isoform X4 [Syngnathus acus]|uniref:uncharacterized protein LOC119117121 isoform X4 n=1 Tax=Syngnathus acus TaxID=161584 RepID=UPI001885FBFB|nr:uncharacterized protein LOC119117121 isoform X4 [Syngnathus acus]
MERARFLGLCGLGYSLLRAQVGSTFVVKSLAGSRFVFSQNEQRPQNGVRSAFLSSFGETFPVRVDCSLKPISLSAAADGGGCERRRPPAESRGGGQGPETHQIGNEQSVMGISFSKSTATGGFSGCKLGWRRSPWQQVRVTLGEEPAGPGVSPLRRGQRGNAPLEGKGGDGGLPLPWRQRQAFLKWEGRNSHFLSMVFFPLFFSVLLSLMHTHSPPPPR